MKPILMAVFPIANDLNLVDERDRLSKVFPVTAALEFDPFSQATFEIVNAQFKNANYTKRVTVFHYGGHANGTNLSFRDAEGNITGFSKLLEELTNLQLVFINGCDSFDQADIILANEKTKNVAIIVTQGKIKDEVALYFAEEFYTIWASNFTIQQAFNMAIAGVATKFPASSFTTTQTERGIKVTGLYESDESTYFLVGNDIQRANNMRESLEGPVIANEYIEYTPSYELVTTISGSILQDNILNIEDKEELTKKFDAYRLDQDDLTNFDYLCLALLKFMPYPIGSHLSLLWSAGKDADITQEYEKLLKMQISTYAASLQLLCFSMLNCLLEETLKFLTTVPSNDGGVLITGLKLDVTRKQIDVLHGFIHSGDPDNVINNSPLLLITIREVITQNRDKGIEPFIEEYSSLQEVFVNETEFMQTHRYILGLKESIKNGQIQQKNIKAECKKMERTMSRIFEKAGFLAKYNLLSVREISIRKTRLEAAEFEIYRTNLVHSSINKYAPKNNGIYTDTHSVMFSRNTAGMGITKYLSLSPFVIDENGIKGELIPNILFFSHREGEDYVFRRSNNPDNIRIIRAGKTYEKDDFTDKSQPHIDIINLRMTAITKELKYFEKMLTELQTLITK